MKNKYFDKAIRASEIHKELVKDILDKTITSSIASENNVSVYEYLGCQDSYICKKGNKVKFFYFEGDVEPIYHFTFTSKEYGNRLKQYDLLRGRTQRCRRTDSVYTYKTLRPKRRYRRFHRTKFRLSSSYPLYAHHTAALERIRAKTLCASSLAKENLKNHCILRTSLKGLHQEQYSFSCAMPDKETIIKFMIDRMSGSNVSFNDLIDADIVIDSYKRIYI